MLGPLPTGAYILLQLRHARHCRARCSRAGELQARTPCTAATHTGAHAAAPTKPPRPLFLSPSLPRPRLLAPPPPPAPARGLQGYRRRRRLLLLRVFSSLSARVRDRQRPYIERAAHAESETPAARPSLSLKSTFSFSEGSARARRLAPSRPPPPPEMYGAFARIDAFLLSLSLSPCLALPLSRSLGQRALQGCQCRREGAFFSGAPRNRASCPINSFGARGPTAVIVESFETTNVNA